MSNIHDNSSPLLKVSGLKQYFGKGKKLVKAVDDVSFEIKKGRIYGLVGESGSGKTTVGRSIIRIYDPTGGSISFKGEEITGRLDKNKRDLITSGIQMIFQDPMASLNPSKKVFDIIAQGIDIHNLASSKAERRDMVFEMMEEVGLSPDFADRYPRQFSGGQRQRIAIARTVIMKPDLIIADEPISALDVSIQAQIINLLKQLQQKYKTTILFIAHDLSMVRYLTDEVGVMNHGHIVEAGETEEIFTNPKDPYTVDLLEAIPRMNPRLAGR
ncbi:MAG: ABC transporter ATP-binding protein [Lachnospiraceae bacterium]|nr:ABC transporter ATP-binding protein [Lachnospiraceae bacterium]